MPDNFKNPPLEFPNSSDENSQDSTSETEPVTSDKKYEWAPEMLQIMADLDHGIDPTSIENFEELEDDEDLEADKGHKIENKAKETLKFRLPPLKVSSKAEGGELQSESTKKRKRGKNDADKNEASEDEDKEARRARKKKKKAEKKARREAKAAEIRQQAKNTDPPPAVLSPALKKRGRPPKPKDGSTNIVTPSHSFDASVFVSIEQPPEMVRGKTHRSDKLVPKKPRVEGPFTLTKSMQWTQFLDKVAECMDIDKENIQLDGMTWAFQRQKEPLPLSTEQGFKTMREQVTAKGQSATVVFVYHPISKKLKKAGHRGRGALGEVEDEDNMVEDSDMANLKEDDSRWGKKLNLDEKLAPIIAQLQNLYSVGNCSDHPDIRCFNWPFRGETWHFELNQGRLSVWANAILRKDVDYEKAPIGRNFFLPKDRLKVNGRSRASEDPVSASNMLGAHNGAPTSNPWQVLSGFLPPAHYGHHLPYASASGPAASYYPFPPASPSFAYHNPGMMPQWGFPGAPSPPQTPAAKPTLQVERLQPMMLQAKFSQDIQAWCSKFHLGDEECAGLSKLGFRVGQSHELLNLDTSMWEWAGISPLAKIRILAACDAEKATD